MSDLAPFASLDEYVAVPRVAGLVMAPDGSRLVVPVQSLAPDGKRYVSALWEVDPDGGPPRRLTRSEPGESAPAILPSGDVLFVSKRPDPAGDGSKDDGEEAPGLWRLPAGGGEAELLVGRAGGVAGVLVAAAKGNIVVAAPALAGPADGDGERRKARRDADVSAVLHESLPVRHWDHDIGPGHLRLLCAGQGGGEPLRDLTPDAQGALEDVGSVIAHDGATVFTGWRVSHPGGRESSRLIAIDVASGDRRVLAAADDRADGQHDYGSPTVAPDGRWVAFVDTTTETTERPPTVTLRLLQLDSGAERDLLPAFPLWPQAPVASADSAAVFFVADEAGHAPVFRVEVDTGEVTRLTAGGAYSEICASPDGSRLYALRSHVDSPPRPVRLDATRADQEAVELDAPGAIHALPGRVENVEAVGPDGTAIRGATRPSGGWGLVVV